MANVSFLRGLQANLPSSTDIKTGAFYLTTDSNRLYVGDNGALKLLNQTVQIVATTNDLPPISKPNDSYTGPLANVNDFYYISGSNILAVCVEVNSVKQWQQINPDSNTTLKRGNDDSAAADAVSVSFSSADGLKVSIEDSDSKKYTGKAAISADKGITLDYTSGLKISGDTYSIGAAAVSGYSNVAEIKLDSANQSDSSFKIKGGDNVTVAMDSNDIKISADNATLSSTDGAEVGVSVTSAGKIQVEVTDSANNKVTGLSDAISITYGKNGGSSALFGNDALSVYTMAEVDEKLNGLNGMTFKGVLSGSNVLPTGASGSDVSIGDVYMAGGDYTIAVSLLKNPPSGDAINLSAKKGDLFIACIADGKSESNGKIAQADVLWAYVPSGDDLSDTLYHAVVTAATMKFDIQDDGNASQGSISFANGTAMNASGAVTDDDLVITLNHADVTCTPSDKTAAADAVAASSDFIALSDITVNSQGHITAYTKQKYTVNTYELQDASVSASSDVATVSIAMQDGASAAAGTADFKIASTSLKVAVDSTVTDQVNINLEWGTF